MKTAGIWFISLLIHGLVGNPDKVTEITLEHFSLRPIHEDQVYSFTYEMKPTVVGGVEWGSTTRSLTVSTLVGKAKGRPDRIVLRNTGEKPLQYWLKLPKTDEWTPVQTLPVLEKHHLHPDIQEVQINVRELLTEPGQVQLPPNPPLSTYAGWSGFEF
ncbi:hypothetical protein PtA15_15A270 [Puccinia triticina]|uniref:Dolichyl-diphosphooligosaccharide--protein glycosyltransferase subunit 1 n=1 Tax=Puccinia triticina TaxID=208348 RepID=A0ABY7D434_9BASI|nr:uncharacterized protein PtA15_15A270 [Puccinia triticina]WAQ91878.1 hypothetical protein PtA15_15A270 [Puccinia triticina]WAR62676.1 hypothetical protein PtB15_15B263 [Puccinia triticina]